MKYEILGNDFDNDVSINRFKLDEELEKQPNKVLYYGERLAEAKKILEKKKIILKEREAVEELNIRSGKIPLQYEGVNKITDKSVEAMVKTVEAIRKMKEEIIDFEYDVQKLDAAYSAICGNKKNLENEVHLYLNNYFSKPNIRSKDDFNSSMYRKNLKERNKANEK